MEQQALDRPHGLIPKIKSALLGWLGVPVELTNHSFWAEFGGGGAHSGESVTVTNALKISAVWACVRLLAETISTLPLMLYQRQPARRVAHSHPLYFLLHDSPNADMTAVTFWETVCASMLLWGNAFVLIHRARGQVTALEFLHPAGMGYRRRRDGSHEYRWSNATGTEQVADEADVLHIPAFTIDGIAGLSPIGYAVNVLGNAIAAERASGTVFRRGLMMSGTFETPNVIAEKHRTEFQTRLEAYRGAINSGSAPLLEGGISYKSLAINPNDAQLLETRAFSIEEICFVPGTGILTPAGPKPIEAIQPGDLVMTHRGRWRPVRHVMRRDYVGTVITTTAKGLESVTATANHPFYAQTVKPTRSHRRAATGSPDWVEAGNLVPRESRQQRGSYHALTIPKLVHDASDSTIDMAQWAEGGVIDDGYVKVSGNARATGVTRHVAAEFDLGWLCGLFAADGSTTDHQVVWYLGPDELHIATALVDRLRSVFGVAASIRRVDSVHRVVASNRVLARFFRECGSQSRLKALPEFVMTGSRDCLRGALDGVIAGDGCAYQGRMQLRSTSEALIWQVRTILWSIGLHGSMRSEDAAVWTIDGRSGASLPMHTLEWRADKAGSGSMIDGDGVALFVLSGAQPSTYAGKVFNLEVEDDESYTTAGGCVHNCRWYRVPPFMIGHSEKSTSWGSGIEQQNIGFLTYALRPWLKRIEQACNRKLLTDTERREFYAEFNFEALLRADSAGRASFYSVMVQNGIYTRNEVREKENLAPLAGADKLTAQVNLAPLDQLGKKPEPPPQRRAGDDLDDNRDDPPETTP